MATGATTSCCATQVTASGSTTPTDDAIVHLVSAILVEQRDEWAIARRYVALDTIAALGDASDVSPAAIAAA